MVAVDWRLRRFERTAFERVMSDIQVSSSGVSDLQTPLPETVRPLSRPTCKEVLMTASAFEFFVAGRGG
jgi:hypothetical protein